MDDDVEKLKNSINELDIKVSILQTAFDAHSTYTKLALDKAEQLMDARLEGMNEFRAQLKEQSGTFMTNMICSSKHDSVNAKIESLQKTTYIGIGMLLVVQIIIQVGIKFL
jgi:hypothetical protein